LRAIWRDFSSVRLINGRRARSRVFPWIFAGTGPPGEMNLLRSFTSGINIRRCVVAAFRALAVSRTAGISHCISARREKAEEPSSIRRCLDGIRPPRHRRDNRTHNHRAVQRSIDRTMPASFGKRSHRASSGCSVNRGDNTFDENKILQPRVSAN